MKIQNAEELNPTAQPTALPFSPMPGFATPDSPGNPALAKTLTEAQAAAKPRPFAKGMLRTYMVLPETNMTAVVVAKLPPQARLIYFAAKTLPENFTGKDLTDAAVKAGLVTRQLPERIIQYYLPRLREDGLFA